MLHVIRGMANSSGTTHIVGPLSEAQANLGCAVSLFCVQKGSEPPVLPSPELVDSYCGSQSVPLVNPGFSIPFAVNMARRIREFDVVHVHAIWNFPSWWAMREASASGIPYMVAPQGSLDDWALNQNRWGKVIYGTFTEIPLMKRATRFQALTRREMHQIKEYGFSARCDVIPNGVEEGLTKCDRRPCPEYFGFPGKFKTLLFLSRIHPKKGLDLLISVATECRKSLPDLRFVVAGDDAGTGYLEEVKNQCKRNGVYERFTFLGEVKGQHKMKVLSSVDAFILPSYSEGLPVAVLEALAVGLPVVVTDECNIPDIADEGAGYVMPAAASDLTDAVLDLFGLSDLERKKLGDKARKLILKKYTWTTIAKQTIDSYTKIMEERQAG